ncbi:RNA 2',3'-cyclic phosphodiesterase [Mediterraneibacter glycyrrhizinilyticus]|uniref:RNA 2',3'-cyclic phosphodiesterase n=1 Tax=Mediterraneibacter glycyrrhizinilyticus TaxID=342942 RepID=UPI00196149A6|nr:RNA 2',3'-cyclic phosphodiesterase [Mediterraneibacter glycyrrhizinilyticus]MBM6752091.1 RNA 2',3'-cyclic phosphodiesterase [Mediterraneibacter glycyrrhizinilyticus]
MRLFIAIRLSDEMKKALVTCMHDLKKQGVEGNYVPAQNLHMTLAFLGEYDDPAKVKEVIRKVPLPEFRLALSEKGNFGNILWAGVKGNQKLKTYVKDLRAALAAEGIPFDKEKFVPHITLIRKVSAKKPYQVHLPKADMTVKKASLMRSEQKNGKMVYKEL